VASCDRRHGQEVSHSVARDYRIVYTMDDDRLVILVVDAGHRREIYR
jgi:Txe/YoeB family toxin of Txe-Axe toxin-antitoxin module